MAQLEIPNRSLFRQPEVCEIASIQPYVLRSWEAEFPDLGVTKAEGGARVYRRADVERVLRIKQLVYGDGLTLAGSGGSSSTSARPTRHRIRRWRISLSSSGRTRASASCTSSEGFASCRRCCPGRLAHQRPRVTVIFSCASLLSGRRRKRRRSPRPSRRRSRRSGSRIFPHQPNTGCSAAW